MEHTDTATCLALLSTTREIEDAIVGGLEWADDVVLCASTIDSGRNRWLPWTAVLTQARKIRRAYVAIDALRTDPAALEALYGAGHLRLVPAADGSMRVNLLRFRRGDRTRIVMMSSGMAPAGLVAPMSAATCWEGHYLLPFSVQTEALLARVSGAAHVPTRLELDKYSKAYYAAAGCWNDLAELGASFLSPTGGDAGVPELELVTRAGEIKAAMALMKKSVSSAATSVERQRVGYQGGNQILQVHWIAPVKTWVFFGKGHNRYWNGFGTERPYPGKSMSISVEINPPLSGIDRRVGGAFGRDPATGDTFLLHRGRIGGGRNGVGSELFWRRFRGGVALREPDREEPCRAAVVGKLGADDFVRELAAFVHEVRRMKLGREA